jgi:hypothetical protein
LGIGYGSCACFVIRGATIFQAAVNAGPAHSAELHAWFIHMSALCALYAGTGLLCPSLGLPPLQTHTAGAAKFVFRAILCPAKGTKHGEPLTPLSAGWHTSPENSSSVIN